jgi:uncharacterized protein YuzE
MMPEISFGIDPDDNEILSICLRLSEDQVVRTVELGPECNLDLDERGEVVGAEYSHHAMWTLSTRPQRNTMLLC